MNIKEFIGKNPTKELLAKLKEAGELNALNVKVVNENKSEATGYVTEYHPVTDRVEIQVRYVNVGVFIACSEKITKQRDEVTVEP